MMDQTTLPPPAGDHMTNLLIRVNNVEQQVKVVQTQLSQYVPTSVNELQLQSIRSAVDRIEHDVSTIKQQVVDLNSKLATQETEARQRDAEQRESQDKLQIRVLWGIVSIVITVLVGILIAYATHLIH
jgi:DNA repair exonuclease SbcCD ATPase subunit